MTPLGAVARGLAAGLVGTAAMTAWQELASKLQQPSGEESSEEDREGEERGGEGDEKQEQGEGSPWESAPAPARVGRRVLEGVFKQEVGEDKIPLLTHAMHWAYGTGWGAVYGLVQGTIRANPLVHGLAFGTGVWAMSYAQLVPMGLYSPPWEYPPKSLAKDLSYHLVYGAGVAAAYEALD